MSLASCEPANDLFCSIAHYIGTISISLGEIKVKSASQTDGQTQRHTRTTQLLNASRAYLGGGCGKYEIHVMSV